MKNQRVLPSRLILFLACAFLSAEAHAVVLISESFVGAGALDGTTAETFSAGITTAGGSSSWVARNIDANNQFRQDGSVVFAGTAEARGSAFLSLGSYINDAKGTATGKFTLTTTFSAITGGFGSDQSGIWISTGFRTSTSGVSSAFYESNLGLATAVTRLRDGTDYFPGPGTSFAMNPISGTGARTYTILLDFTPEGGYNGTSNFGTVTFFSDNGPADGHSYTYTTDQNFAAVGFSNNFSANTVISNFTLSQIPEPSAIALGMLGSLVLLGRRR